MSAGVQSASACEEQFSSRLSAERDSNTSCPETVLNYEEQFAYRFTTADATYQEYLKRDSDPPPIVEEWRGRGAGNARGRDNRYHEYRPYRGRDRSRGWSGDQWGSQQWQDRHWAQGSGQYHPQSRYQNSYNQGHSSYNQREPSNQY